MANQVIPVIVQRFQAQIAVQGLVEPQRTGVGINGICGGSALSELFFKILQALLCLLVQITVFHVLTPTNLQPD